MRPPRIPAPPGAAGLARYARLFLPVKAVGVLLLCAALWFGLGATGRPPFSTIWLRALVVGAILLVAGAVALLGWARRRRASAALERDLVAPRAEGDAAVLSERMAGALDTLRRAGGKTYLYDLPWYVIIGPPGAGKTTALRNSGLEFPGSRLEAVEGFSGTRSCDWWFTEEAVLLDTAGRYTTQDSDAGADAASWTAFLQLLKKHRPRQPINGVILAFSCEDLMGARAEDLARHAAAVRQRLSEIHEHLRIDFPVYLIFSKADLIAGFRETFAMLTPQRRKAVWGVTFQTRNRQEPTWQAAEKEFEALVAKLSDGLSDRLADEIDGPARLAIFGFPGQMALLRANLVDFLRQVFAPTRYGTTAILRGFYFASGTQEGTPIDQVLGAMARDAGGEAEAGGGFRPMQLSGKGKAFFLEDLLSRVIFAERDWVGFDAAAARRGAVLRSVAITGLAVLSAGLAGLLAAAFFTNDRLLDRARDRALLYEDAAGAEIGRRTIDDPNPSGVVELLDDLRAMTGVCEAGADSEAVAADAAGEAEGEVGGVLAGFHLGLPVLDQQARVCDAARIAYRDGLDRLLRPRLLLQAESDIAQLIADGDEARLYRALKVYLLLGRATDGERDDDALRGYYEDIWARDLSGATRLEMRESLERHLVAMLELETSLPGEGGSAEDNQLDGVLIPAAREAILDVSLAERAFAMILDSADGGEEGFLSLAELAGDEAGDVFEAAGDTPLEELGVPAIYGFEGYWGHFISEVRNIRQRFEDESWVLDEEAEEVGFEEQLGELEEDLQELYARGFREAWDGLLAQLAVRPVGGEEGLDILKQASVQDSPILLLIANVEAETRMDRLLEDALAAAEVVGPEAFDGEALPAEAEGEQLRRLFAESGTVRELLREALADAAKDPERAGAAETGSPFAAAEDLSEMMEDWHLSEETFEFIKVSLQGVRDSRHEFERNPTPNNRSVLQQSLAQLTLNNSGFPDPLARWLDEIDSDLRAEEEDSTMEELQRALGEVAAFCEQRIAGHFPFGDGDAVALNDFNAFFGPNGLMHNFFATHLSTLVTQTPEGLRPLDGSALAGRLSPEALEQFRRAQDIQRAFFPPGAEEAEVLMDISVVRTSPGVTAVFLTIGEDRLGVEPGDEVSESFEWPGEESGVFIEIAGGGQDTEPRRFDGGRWAIVDFLQGEEREVDGRTVTVSHFDGGRGARFRVEFPNSETVPFLMPELRDFSCPATLEAAP